METRGTLGGNICNASPAGDTLPLLYVYNAKLLLRSSKGERIVGISDFIQGVRRVQRDQNEILVEIILPSIFEEGAHVFFEKVGNRNADAIAKVAFAGYIRLMVMSLMMFVLRSGRLDQQWFVHLILKKSCMEKPFH